MTRHPQPEVAVVGGGPAGSATALALVGRGFAVALIEASAYADVRVGEHLSPAARPALARLGVDGAVEESGPRRCGGIRSAWGEDALADRDYFFGPHGDGLHLSRPAFDARLAREARSRGAELLTETRARTVERRHGRWQLTLACGGELVRREADFLVDATGRAAAVARRLGGRRIVWDKLVGIAGVLRPRTADHGLEENELLLEACEDGWWYSAPLADGRRVSTFMTDADLALSGASRALELWRDRLHSSRFVRRRLRSLRPPSRVHVRSAGSQRLDVAAGDGWLAVGDAAISFDPLSSAGIAKGLRSGLRAAAAIEAHFDGDRSALDDYQRELEADFDEYLVERAAYYRLEDRWPRSPFWRRRQRPVPGELPITLDPATVISVRPASAARVVRSVLDELTPALDADRLLRLLRTPRPAHQVVARYRTPAHDRRRDRDVIVALQILLARDLLSEPGGAIRNPKLER